MPQQNSISFLCQVNWYITGNFEFITFFIHWICYSLASAWRGPPFISINNEIQLTSTIVLCFSFANYYFVLMIIWSITFVKILVWKTSSFHSCSVVTMSNVAHFNLHAYHSLCCQMIYNLLMTILFWFVLQFVMD